jgi:hypothetical protein
LGASLTMFSDTLQKFVEKSPTTVMACDLLERLLNPETLDRWFDATAQAQYTRDILFSADAADRVSHPSERLIGG